MENRRIIIKLHGENISLKDLAEAISNTHSLLGELDTVVSGGKSILWTAGDLRGGSAEFSANPHLIDADAPDIRHEVLKLCYDGLRDLETTQDRPKGFTDKALEYAKGLVSQVNDTVTRMTCTAVLNGKAEEPFTLSQHIAANVSGIMGAARTSYGSIEGSLEVLNGISNSFSVVDRVTKRRIRCESSKVTLAALAESHWERVIVVTGQITEDREGHPRSIKVESYRALSDSGDLPQAEDIRGLYALGNDG